MTGYEEITLAKDFVRLALASSAIVLLCILPATGLIIISNLLPSQQIKEKVFSGRSIENYYVDPITERRIDYYTECVYLTVGMRTASEEETSLNLAYSNAITSPTLGDCKKINANRGARDYFRYWHGSQIIARPVLLFSDVNTLRWVTFSAFAVCFCFLAYTIGTEVNWLTAGIFSAMIAASPLYSQLFIMPHAAPWIIGFILAAIILRSKRTNLLWLTVAGVLLAYFDLLTNPVVVPTAALFALTLTRWRDDAGSNFTEVTLGLAAWFVGYAGFWSMKWLLAATVVGTASVAENISRVFLFRLSGERHGQEMTPWTSISVNFAELNVNSVAILSLCFVAGLIGLAVARRGHKELIRRATACWRLGMQMALIGLLPLLWIMTIRNHSIIHAWFVAPVLSWTMICFITAVQILTSGPSTIKGQESAMTKIRETKPASV